MNYKINQGLDDFFHAILNRRFDEKKKIPRTNPRDLKKIFFSGEQFVDVCGDGTIRIVGVTKEFQVVYIK